MGGRMKITTEDMGKNPSLMISILGDLRACVVNAFLACSEKSDSGLRNIRFFFLNVAAEAGPTISPNDVVQREHAKQLLKIGTMHHGDDRPLPDDSESGVKRKVLVNVRHMVQQRGAKRLIGIRHV